MVATPARTNEGMVVRSHTFAFMAAAARVERIRQNPLVAEALALRWSLEAAQEMGLESVLFESNSAIVIPQGLTHLKLK